MDVRISDPRTDLDGLTELAPLWHELHSHHREISDYRDLVEDLDSSWASRLAESLVRERGFDTVKIGVMSGNASAQAFYERHGYSVGEHILYRRLDGKSAQGRIE